MLTHGGESPKNASNAATCILGIETLLATASMSANERRDVVKLYNKMPIAKLGALTPLVNWKQYLKEIGAGNTRSVIVGQVAYMKKLSSIVKSVSIEEWKQYLRFRLVVRFAGQLPQAVSKTSFEFYGKTLTGQKEQKPRWQRVIGVIDGAMTEAIGKEYVTRYFSRDAEKIIEEMIKNLKSAYRERIKSLDWMSAATKEKAQKKLSTFVSKIAAPRKPRTYRELPISPTGYLRNVLRAEQSEFAREICKLIQSSVRMRSAYALFRFLIISRIVASASLLK